MPPRACHHRAVTRDRRLLAPPLLLALLAALAGGARPASAADAPITGEGSHWAASAIDQWRAAEPEFSSVSYAETGSTAGLTAFANGADDFAVTDLPYGLSGATPDVPARASRYVPAVGGGVALLFHVSAGGHLISNLNLSSAAIAGIFAGSITTWDDPAIAATNPNIALPDLKITPVVRSDAAGSSDVLTRWLAHEQPATWTCGETATFTACPQYDPAVQLARPGDTGVAAYIGQTTTNGTIGYVENSYAYQVGMPVASVQNALGTFTRPVPRNIVVSLSQATVAPDGTEDLDGLYAFRDYRTYPLAHYDYAVIPTASDDSGMTAAKRQSIADFLTYGLCAGQQAAAQLGYAPLPLNLVRVGLTQIRRLGPDADGGAVVGVSVPDVDTSLAHCDNPTFDKTDLNRDVLGLDVDGTPAPTGTPRIAGTVRVGAELAVRVGVWKHVRSYAVHWLADGSPISGATSPIYAVRPALLGKHLSVQITAVSGDGQRTTVTTAPTAAVAKGRLSMTRPTVHGRLRVGRLVYAGTSVMATSPEAQTDVPGNWPLQPGGNPAVSYRWYAGGRLIRGADHGYLTIGRAQVGKRLTVKLTARLSGYVTLTKTSRASGVVRR